MDGRNIVERLKSTGTPIKDLPFCGVKIIFKKINKNAEWVEQTHIITPRNMNMDTRNIAVRPRRESTGIKEWKIYRGWTKKKKKVV